KFETDFDIEMSDVLKGMGMIDAFDADKADFTAMGTSEINNIFISRVIHKTFISVAEQGTKAGAATLVEMTEGCALPEEEPKEVILNRPFVYMLVDCESWTPFFIGTLMRVN
ncbi:MAG: serpin, partial [Firmicutes bacterium]|nr:serpin [Bacillota bacterium]